MIFLAVAEVVFGVVLVGLFAVIIAYYYSRKRKTPVEEVKYKMLDDDD
ncbi:MAG: CcoQ/FixQ family Cbb3-type cytochrome c oxidase assembly chaperone [Spirochaetota bacterium]